MWVVLERTIVTAIECCRGSDSRELERTGLTRCQQENCNLQAKEIMLPGLLPGSLQCDADFTKLALEIWYLGYTVTSEDMAGIPYWVGICILQGTWPMSLLSNDHATSPWCPNSHVAVFPRGFHDDLVPLTISQHASTNHSFLWSRDPYLLKEELNKFVLLKGHS